MVLGRNGRCARCNADEKQIKDPELIKKGRLQCIESA